MPQLYRSMKEDADGLPVTGPNARALGIRPGVDVPPLRPVDPVGPRQGGLSVAPGDPVHLPYFRRPPEFGGTGKDPVWSLDSVLLGAGLCYRPDPANPYHGFIEPDRVVTLDEYQRALALTRSLWARVRPSP